MSIHHHTNSQGQKKICTNYKRSAKTQEVERR